MQCESFASTTSTHCVSFGNVSLALIALRVGEWVAYMLCLVIWTRGCAKTMCARCECAAFARCIYKRTTHSKWVINKKPGVTRR